MTPGATVREAAALLLALLLGLLVGATGCFLQEWALGPVPVGLLLALGATAWAVVWAGGLGRARALPLLVTLGWLVASVPLSGARQEGDLVVQGDWVGVTWAYGGMALVTLTAMAVVSTRSHAEG